MAVDSHNAVDKHHGRGRHEAGRDRRPRAAAAVAAASRTRRRGLNGE
jgi:hypothetical protein